MKYIKCAYHKSVRNQNGTKYLHDNHIDVGVYFAYICLGVVHSKLHITISFMRFLCMTIVSASEQDIDEGDRH